MDSKEPHRRKGSGEVLCRPKGGCTYSVSVPADSVAMFGERDTQIFRSDNQGIVDREGFEVQVVHYVL